MGAGEAGNAQEVGEAVEAVDAVEAVTPEGVAAAAEMLAGWLREARGADEPSGTLTFCAACGFTLPCPWGC